MATEETPVMEEPKEEPTNQEVSAEDQANEILAELTNLGIDSVEKVQGMHTASGESGNLARMLGEQRQITESLQAQIQQLTAQSQPQQYVDEYGSPQQPPMDTNSIKNAIREVYQNDILKPQVEQTNRVYGELSQIQNDPDYALLGQMWDKHWNSPNTQHRIMTGQSSPKGEYDNLRMTYYRTALKKTHGALQGVMESKAKPPHVEIGDQTHVDMPTPLDIHSDDVKKIVKNNTGGDGDMEALVKAFLPADAFKT